MANGDRSTRELRATLVAAHAAAVDAVGGRQSVARYLATLSADEHPTQAVAIGKAAADMMAGAFDNQPPTWASTMVQDYQRLRAYTERVQTTVGVFGR